MKKVLKILTLIMLIITILKIADTYSKYYTRAHTSSLTKDIGEWVIKVNEMDIYSENGASVELVIDKFNNYTNNYASPDKIAPFSEGYTDIVIDPTGTDVAVRYDMQIEVPETSVLDLEARLEMISDEEVLIKTGENTYTGIINLSDVQQGKKANIRAYILWMNNEEKNEEDTAIATTEQRENLEISVNLTVSQYLGEEITEYVE